MKKLVIEMLPKGAIDYENGNTILKYIKREGEKMCLKKKVLSMKPQNVRIEEHWKDVMIPLELTKILCKNIGMSKIVRNQAEIEGAKKWVFGSILYGILVQEVVPKDCVCMWIEEVKEGYKVTGICEVE